MYVPAERNFLSVVDRPDKLKNLPSPLFTFLEEYGGARNLFATGIDLPINNVRFEYDKLNNLAHIVGQDDGYRIRLSEASSGFQSTVPLYLVTRYLSERLNSEEDISVKENSIEEQRKLDKEIKTILEDTQLTPDIRQTYLRQLSAKRKPACFINIVEEPEQNLFPSSQQSVLNELLKYANMTDGNRLIMTTHSPFIINYLTVAVKANQLKAKIDDVNLKNRLSQIVPVDSTVKADELAIYELNEKEGVVKALCTYSGIPSDENYLNKALELGNKQYDSLLEIEEEI